MLSTSSDIDRFLYRYQEFLNEDPELKRRLEPFPSFRGGPTPYPGPGPYPPPNVAMDPTGWSKAKGYPVTRLKGRDLVEINVEGKFRFTVGLRTDGTFYVEERSGVNPCLKVSMPLSVFKDMVLGKERVIYALADERNVIEYDNSLGLSDWITIFEVIGIMQELVESDREMWEIIENLRGD